MYCIDDVVSVAVKRKFRVFFCELFAKRVRREMGRRVTMEGYGTKDLITCSESSCSRSSARAYLLLLRSYRDAPEPTSAAYPPPQSVMSDEPECS